jgi:glycosyltransferase involved in cell wall biosynthesis
MTTPQSDFTSKRLSVMMIAEGTYPFHWGGVSTWCHLLLNDLPNIDFTLVSLIGDPNMTPAFSLPANVVDFRPIPLWGIREVLENRPDLSMGELRRRRSSTTRQVVASRFVPIFRAFLQDLFAETGNPEQLGRLIHQMHRFFLKYDFDTAMRSRVVWRCFVRVAQECFPRAAAQYGYADARFHLADLTACMQWLYHWLFPIAAPLPKTDVAHAAMAGICTLVGVTVKLEHGAAFMLTEHGIYLRERYLAEAATATTLFRKLFSLRFARRMTELSYAMADQIAPCCDFNRRWELRNGAKSEQIQTIYYGVDGSVFVPTYKPFGEPPVVVWVGRIDPLKDLITLLQAAAVVHKARPDIEFRLFGSAPAGNESYYERCLELRKELGLEDAVVFAGFRSNTASAFNEGDVVVLSSVSEAFPFVILEAMLCEKPVVATAVGGIPEQIEGCGFTVEPRNPEAMAEAILTLMNDKELAMSLGAAARAKATSEYSVRQSGMAHDTTYRRLAARRRVITGVETRPESAQERALAMQQAGSSGAGAKIAHRTPQLYSNSPETIEVESGVPASKRMVSMQMANGAPTAQAVAVLTGGGGAADVVLPGLGGGEQGGVANPGAVRPANNIGHTRSFGANSRSHRPMERNADWQSTHASALAMVTAEVARRDTEPIDALEVTALMESMGITDEVAVQRYGAPDAFELGNAVFKRMKSNRLAAQVTERVEEPKFTFQETLLNFLRGPLALVPPLLILLVILAFGRFGGWTDTQLLMLSSGMTCSMLVVNGFVQAISRRMSVYLGLRKPQAAAHFFWLSAGVALACVGAIAGIVVWLTTQFGLFTITERLIFAGGFVGLSSLWMVGGSLALIERTAWLSISLATGLVVGVLVSLAVAPFWNGHLIVASVVGYSVAMTLMIYVFSQGLNKRLVGKPAKASKVNFPSNAYLFQEAWPYFAYGSLYMILFLLPHVLGWIGGLAAGEARALAITSVEIGMTLAMPPLILVSGVAEHALRLFWRVAPAMQENTPGEQVPLFHERLVEFYRRHRMNYILTLVTLNILFMLGFWVATDLGMWGAWPHLVSSAPASFIFDTSLIAYALLGLGLFNSMFCITVGRPQLAVRALLWGIAVTILVGAPLCAISYQYSALSFIFGAAVFAFVSWRMVSQVLNLMDYHFASTI